MKILIDTNVLVSSALHSDGTPFKAFVKAVSSPNQGLICEQNIIELRKIFNRKFPNKIRALDSFLAMSLLVIKVIPVPDTIYDLESQVRDVTDRPILRAALSADVDYFPIDFKTKYIQTIKEPLRLLFC